MSEQDLSETVIREPEPPGAVIEHHRQHRLALLWAPRFGAPPGGASPDPLGRPEPPPGGRPPREARSPPRLNDMTTGQDME